MAAQQGRALLVKMGTGSGSPEVFNTVAGLRARSIALNAETVDVTNANSSAAWRELLAGAGLKSASVSGAGVFKDDATDAMIQAAFFAQSQDNWQIVVPDFGTIEGPFLVTALEYAGAHDGEMTVSLTLQSAGALSFS